MLHDFLFIDEDKKVYAEIDPEFIRDLIFEDVIEVDYPLSPAGNGSLQFFLQFLQQQETDKK